MFQRLVVILASEFLKNAKPYLLDGVSPQLIVNAYHKASQEVSSFV
jgi:chaperonin GroEL (HSP60 family)